MSCSRIQRSDASKARTSGPSVSSQALYHCATALPNISNNITHKVSSLENKTFVNLLTDNLSFIANSSDPDQARQGFWPDLDPNCF